jgi:hypothetical protein
MPGLPKIPPLPPPFDALGRQLVVGLGKVATRAMASGAKSVTNDVKRMGRTMQKAAERAGQRLDQIVNPDDQDEEE